jgi:ribulose-phosphate 3-epimerase
MPTLAPSIIAADYARLEEHCHEALDGGGDWLHVDVMDGHFVPNLTVGPGVVEALRPLADRMDAKVDVHLMVDEPGRYVDAFAEAGADLITVHVEACTHLHRVVQRIDDLGCETGVALNPGTPLSQLEAVLPFVDLALVMSVNPGFSGQSYIPQSTAKVRRLHRQLNALGSEAYLEVDGGVKPGNAMEIVQAGADVLVAGSAIFGGEGPVADNVEAFRSALTLKV